ncbi:hypothetical protein M9H77_31503 [Catharanthus roseus]|uniref:Uncharacterized protein n=1 Tax=Catharanthus roseus TaxID=4058 RepID=A0ACC0A463_CATRO|nr:hypothetical protein M9H77_31503 [Catharanthus roseus]
MPGRLGVGHPGRPLATRGPSAWPLFNYYYCFVSRANSCSPPLDRLSFSLSFGVFKTFGFSSFSFDSAAAILSLFWCFYAVREIAVRKEKREKDRGSRLPVISSWLRPVSENYNPDHHFSSLSTPRRGSAVAQRPLFFW